MEYFSRSEKDLIDRQNDALNKINAIGQQLLAGLSEYSPRVLTTYKKGETLYSEILEFLSYLNNLESVPRVVNRSPIHQDLSYTRKFFGDETIEIRGASKSKYCACLGVSDYSDRSEPGLLNQVLSTQHHVIICQSFSFVSHTSAQRMMEKERRKKINAGDLSESQVEELREAVDRLTRKEFAMGFHSLSAFVFVDERNQLNKALEDLRPCFTDIGIMMTREDLALQAAFFNLMPGNFKYIPRKKNRSPLSIWPDCSVYIISQLVVKRIMNGEIMSPYLKRHLQPLIFLTFIKRENQIQLRPVTPS